MKSKTRSLPFHRTLATADFTGTYGVDFLVETSATLASGSWTAETSGGNVTLTGNDVKYTFPAGPAQNFVRLRVKAN